MRPGVVEGVLTGCQRVSGCTWGTFCVRNGSGRAEKWTSISPWSKAPTKAFLGRATPLKVQVAGASNHPSIIPYYQMPYSPRIAY